MQFNSAAQTAYYSHNTHRCYFNAENLFIAVSVQYAQDLFYFYSVTKRTNYSSCSVIAEISHFFIFVLFLISTNQGFSSIIENTDTQHNTETQRTSARTNLACALVSDQFNSKCSCCPLLRVLWSTYSTLLISCTVATVLMMKNDSH